MAVNVNDPNQQNQQNQGVNPQGPVNASNPAQYTAQSEQPRQKGTGFTNLQRVIGANQDNRLGQTIGGGIQNLAQGAKTRLQQTQNQFQQQSQQAQEQTRKDADASQRALQQIAQNYGQQPQQPQGQPDQGANIAPETMQAFNRLGRGQYQGPLKLDVNGQLQSNINEVQNLGKLAGSQNRGALLQRFVGGAGYAPGQQKLDAMLLGQTAAPQLAQATRSGTQIGNTLNQAQQQALVQAQQGQQELTQAKQQALAGAQSTEGALDQTLAQRQQQQIAANQDLYNQMQAALNASKVGQQPGLTPLMELYARGGGNAQNTQFLNAKDFLGALGNFDASAINKSTVANEQDLARANALKNISGALGGQYDTGLTPDQINAAANNKFLGINLDAGRIQQAQQQRQQGYTQAIQAPQQRYDFTSKASQLLNSVQDGGALNEIANNPAYGEAYRLANQLANEAVSLGLTTKGHGFRTNAGAVDLERARQYFAQQAQQSQNNINQVKNNFDFAGLTGDYANPKGLMK